MSSLSNTNKLFGNSGCLSMYAIEQYENNALTDEDMALVKEHLNSCMLCKDAVEGLSSSDQIQEHDYPKDKNKNIFMEDHSASSHYMLNAPSSIIDKTDIINYRLRRKFNYNPTWRRSRRREPRLRQLFIPAAASIIILIGIIAYFQFYFPEKNELAQLDQADAIVQFEEKEVSPVLLIDSNEHDIAMQEEHIEEMVEEIASRPLPPPVPTEPTEQVVGGIAQESHVSEEEIIKEEPNEVAEAETSYSMEKTSDAGLNKKSIMATKSMSKGDRESQDYSTIYTVVDQMPEFPGGEDSLNLFTQKNLIFPDTYDPGVKKTIILTFVIDEKGLIDDIKVLRGREYAFQAEAINLVKKMPPWEPGKQRGKAVRVQYILSITFEKPQ